MDIIQQWIIPGIFFLGTVGFGFWVSKAGKPYNGLLFNIHKLIALGAAILTGIRVFKLNPFSTFPNLVIILFGLAVFGVISMFATGAIMSIRDQENRAAQLMHQVSVGIITGAMIFGLYVLNQ